MYRVIFLMNLFPFIWGFQYFVATPPFGVFDPLKLSNNIDKSTLQKYREAELKHGRWAMIGTLSLPLIESQTNAPAIHMFDNLSTNYQVLLVGLILATEANILVRGWQNPFSLGKNKYFTMKDEYQPGDLGFGISSKYNVEMYDKELNNGRLAMIGMMSFFLQELMTNKAIF